VHYIESANTRIAFKPIRSSRRPRKVVAEHDSLEILLLAQPKKRVAKTSTCTSLLKTNSVGYPAAVAVEQMIYLSRR
jgi:hypothetical protein